MTKFIKKLERNNYSKNTIRTYKSVLNQYIDCWSNINLIKKAIRNSNLSPNTIHLHYNVLIQYMKFNNDKRIKSLQELKLPNIPVKYQHTFTKSFLIRKTSTSEGDSDLVRNKKNVVRFLFETGVRATEIFQIIQTNKKTMLILGKGNKQREIFHNWETTSQLPDLNFTYKTLRIWTKDVLGKKYTPHSIRRSFATHMLLGGANPRMVSRQLGHSKIETTFRYLHTSEHQNYKTYKKYILV